MNKLFYKIITNLPGKLGIWIFKIYAGIVSAGFFLFFPKRVLMSVKFYQALFPNKDRLYHIQCAWKQFHNFTTVFTDRLGLQKSQEISYTSSGWNHIEEAVRNKTGGIILMSHMGNWEMAAHLFKKKMPDAPLLFYMGVKHKEQMENIQKQSLAQSGIKIIAADQTASSPFDLIEGINFLKSGGLVSLTGDIIWHKYQRSVEVEFLGQKAVIPEVPHIFALLSGVPLFVFFAFRSQENQYYFTITEPLFIKSTSRKNRNAEIKKSAQRYADLLEKALGQYPFQWYHFERFLKY
ncbi:Lipid A biosynthesis acyltransferase family protein [Desulfonema limicola]|uniref:Lipid A biosynthesis acyltransferase family protein n=1 Tax=Desulfonema limicola TaxID=45656 RepID=A0A975GFW6_9BACT|nr:lysophospholipid acyltransferase family protein [Desulfonema limicola]QTA79590.1 Lipid A biosynthesis acyltransferase family protein [Desulfonema limicola]